MTVLLAFVRLSRPLFLFGGVVGVALGAAVAAWTGVRLDLATYGWAQLMVTAFQLMVHYANDYFDRDGDRLDGRTAWSGGSGVLPSGALQPRVALTAALVCAATGLCVAVRFALLGDAIAGGLGIAIFALAWSYSAPPLRLAARGLGELDTSLVVAVLVPSATYAAFAGRLHPQLIDAAIPPAIAMAAMMLAVELPDAAGDRASGKGTLIVRYGPSKAPGVVAGLAGVAACLAVLQTVQLAPWAVVTVAPAVVVAAVLFRTGFGEARPATIAFWGVALYPLITAGLAAAYALAPGAR